MPNEITAVPTEQSHRIEFMGVRNHVLHTVVEDGWCDLAQLSASAVRPANGPRRGQMVRGGRSSAPNTALGRNAASEGKRSATARGNDCNAGPEAGSGGAEHTAEQSAQDEETGITRPSS